LKKFVSYSSSNFQILKFSNSERCQRQLILKKHSGFKRRRSYCTHQGRRAALEKARIRTCHLSIGKPNEHPHTAQRTGPFENRIKKETIRCITFLINWGWPNPILQKAEKWLK
jgi:hypothetical protein